MPVVTDYAYFDHAAVSPVPTTSANAMQRWVGEVHSAGNIHWPRWHSEIEATRRACATLICAQADEICLVPNTTFGVNIVASGLPWQPGDSVIVPSNEFPSNYVAWHYLKHRGVEIRTVEPEPTGAINIQSIMNLVDHTTRLISVSWVGYSTGYRIGLENLIAQAKVRGVLVFVDAIQGLGAFPLDAESLQVDFLAADGHKWLLGPEGAGVLYIAQRNLERLTPQMIGWNSVVRTTGYSNQNLTLRSQAARFEGGSSNAVGMIGFGASVQTLLDAGCHNPTSGFSEAILNLADYAVVRLKSIGAEVYRDYDRSNYSGIVSFDMPGAEPGLVRKRCISQNVILSVRDNRLRIAIHGYNTEHDVDRLIDAIQKT